MGRSIEDYGVSLEFRDVMRKFIAAEVERLRPKYRYATVTAVDSGNSKVTVQFPGEAGTADVPVPAGVTGIDVGSTVRVDGIRGDRFIQAGGGGAPPIWAEQPNEPVDLPIHYLWFDTDEQGVLPGVGTLSFTKSYVKLTKGSQTFGNELSVAWSAETTSGDTSWRGSNAVPTSVPDVAVTQPYAVFGYIATTSDPGNIVPEIRWNGPAIRGAFTVSGASAWVARPNGVIVPDVTALSTITLTGAGTTSDFTFDSAELWIYPLFSGIGIA